MANLASRSVVRQLGSLFEGGSVAGLSDRQLLERFIAQRRCRPARPPSPRWWPARADGAGRLPAAPGRPPPCRGRLPGRLPRPGPQGPVDPRPRPAGQLALRGRAPDGAVRKATDRPPAPARGGRHDEASRSGLVRPGRADGPAGRPAGDRPRAGRGPPRRDRPPAAGLPPAGGALLLRGPHPRRGGHAPPLPGRHAPQPAGPGAREAPDRPDSPRRCPARRRAGRGPGAPVRLGVRSSPPVRFHHPGRDRSSRPVTPPPVGRSRPPPRHWPRRSSVPCSSTSSSSPRCPCLLLAAVATGAGWLAHSLAMKDDPVKNRRPRWRESRRATPTGPSPRRNPIPPPRPG